MKTQNILLLLLIVLLNGCFSKDHLEFSNIPINGSINEFAGELINRGYTESSLKEEDQIVLIGEYLEKNSEIYLYGTDKSQAIYKVTVILPVEDRDSLEYSFDKIQRLFTTKYGKGMSRYHQYRNSERFLFNEPKRLRRLSTGDFTRYTTNSGVITIEVRLGFIAITYLDKINNKICQREL
jgi:hypothetical protein